MELSYINPSKASLIFNSGREYILRLVSLEDEGWIKDNFSDDLNGAMDDPNKLSRIIYRLIEDKSDFKLQDVVTIDEDGNEVIEKIGGHKLLKRMICGLQDKISMITAFNQALGVSRPILDENEEEEEEAEANDKKKI